MASGGYVRIHRPLFEDHPAFRNDAEAMAFAWLIVKAAWKPTSVRYKDRRLNLQRGQAAVSVRDMARALDRDKGWVERLLKRLKNEAMIETRHETGINVITICNYNEYQADGAPPETPSKTLSETDARQAQDTEQEREEVKKISSEAKASSQSAKNGICFPADWTVPARSELPPKARACAEQWTDDSYETEAEGFALYWRNSKKRRPDWTATWAAWVIRQNSKILRDQKFGNAAPATKKVLTVPEQIEALKKNIELFSRIGRDDDVRDCRRRLARLEVGKPPGEIGDLISRVTYGMKA